MGDLLKGAWRAEGDFPRDGTGRFVRPESPFRNWVTADGKPGPTGVGGFQAAAGRYHLFVSLACPWAHRTLIFRKLKGLESMVSLSVVHWLLGERGWTFDEGEGVIPDPIFGAKRLSEFYLEARGDFTGRVTVPVLWDKRATPSSTTSRPRSSACSTALSTRSARRKATIIRSSSGARSTR